MVCDPPSMLNKITNRILLGFSIPFLFLLLLGAMLYSTTNQLIRLQEDTQRTAQNLRDTNELAYDITRIIVSIRGYALYPGDQYYRGTYDSGREAMLKDIQDLKTVTDPQGRELVDKMIELGEEYDRVAAGVYPLVDANNLAGAKKQIEIPRVARLEEARKRAVEALENRLTEYTKEGAKAKQFEFLLIVIGTGLTILATMLTALWIVIPLRRQLPKVVHAAEQIADGDLRQTVEATQDGSEIGQLLAAFQLSQASQQTAASLQETNRAIQQLDEAAHGLRMEITRFKIA